MPCLLRNLLPFQLCFHSTPQNSCQPEQGPADPSRTASTEVAAQAQSAALAPEVVARCRAEARAAFCAGLTTSALVAQLLQRVPGLSATRPDVLAVASIARQEFAAFSQEEHKARVAFARADVQKLLRVQRRIPPGSLVAIARRHHASPVAVARTALRLHAAAEGGSARDQRQRVTAWLRDPGALSSGPEAVALGEAVRECVDADDEAGPSTDATRQAMGQALEHVLEARISALGVPFDSEEALRARGARVTPDALLLVPIAVASRRRDDASGPLSEAAIVNWIDSKAMFGTLDVVRTHAEQCQAYVREFGKGAIIYWFGIEAGAEDALGPSVFALSGFPSAVLLPGGVRPAGPSPESDGIPTPDHLGGAALDALCTGSVGACAASAASAGTPSLAAVR